MSRFVAALLLLCLSLTAPLHAQDRARAILVLDASGSMWGQIDGVAKITIAQQVIGDLLQSLPVEQELGLTLYGHRRKGDCSDIETPILPDGDQRAAIADAVNAIKPKGKTPLSAAVIAAAEALKYSEERATVILVSDGRETCDFDPCDVGRQLEETGVDFTAHVIGFDVSDPADRAELQCLADQTGGTFTTASNASELAQALVVVAEPPAPPPPPAPVTVTLRATEGAGGPVISDGLVWALSDSDGTALLTSQSGAAPSLSLTPGTYLASVTRSLDGAMADSTFSVEGINEVITVALPELPPEPVNIGFHAIDGKNGPKINDLLIWDIIAEDGTPVLESESTASGSIALTKGTYRIEVLRPADEASGEARFGVGTEAKTVVLELPEFRPPATLDAPETGVAGDHVQVGWTGPDAPNDFISVARTDSPDGVYEEYTYTRQGALLDLRMPTEPGTYEIRYILNEGRKALARRQITVTGVTASIVAPTDPLAGATVQVEWKGPDYQNDFIAVTKRGEDKWINYTYTRQGSPLGLVMPGAAGEYDIIYTLNQDRSVIARVPVTVSGVDFALSAPQSVLAGSAVPVTWTGPDYQNDFISISTPESRDGAFETYTYTRQGNPLNVTAPLTPGDYELRYVLNQDRKVTARIPLKVEAISASLQAPATAPVGASISIDWKGPGYQRDYIAVAAPGQEDAKYVNYTYTRTGSPLTLLMPSEPGAYELRYIAATGEKSLLTRQPITVTPVTAGLQAAGTVAADGNLSVEWKGPDYQGDYVAISKVDDLGGYETYTYTRTGSPLIIKAPKTPGTYELRYVMKQDRVILARQTLVVQ